MGYEALGCPSWSLSPPCRKSPGRDAIPMQERVCLVTGATSGVGREVARRLAAVGATVILAARSAERGKATIQAIQSLQPEARLDLLVADLSSLEQVRRLARQVVERHQRLDLLVNNAGAIYPHRLTSDDGFEMTFAVNHLAHYLLTCLLLNLLRASAPALIINVSSAAHFRGWFGWEAPEGGYSSLRRYADSKLANVLFTYELARRLEGSGVRVNCVHPGLVRSRFGENHRWWFRVAKALYLRFRGLTEEQGAASVIYLALSPEVANISGAYFERCRIAPSSAYSLDETAAARLWSLSERLTGWREA